MSGLSLGIRVSNLKSVALTILELLAFNAQKFRGSVDHTTPPFGKIFGGHVRTVSGNTCVIFEVRIALTVLELLAFNAQKFRGHVTVATPPFGTIFGGHVRTVPGNTYVIFEVRSFNRSVALSI